MEDIAPARGHSRLPVIGLGGSAGGLTAPEAFFGAMPPDCGMAFVVIMHLSPSTRAFWLKCSSVRPQCPCARCRTASGFRRTYPDETGAQLQDLLISVTNFSRDRDAFAVLEAAIPGLFRGRTSRDTVRGWCAACATGEEGYSVAMLLTEYANTF